MPALPGAGGGGRRNPTEHEGDEWQLPNPLCLALSWGQRPLTLQRMNETDPPPIPFTITGITTALQRAAPSGAGLGRTVA